MHVSIPSSSVCELLNFTPLNPLISKCQIKVCYVGESPNRNGSVITKETATEMARSLPGCPIVGFFNNVTGDFEEHNKVIKISSSDFEITDSTRPYGFVDLNAKVWFQKFLDDGVEHEYLMTEGYIWSEVYPESRRIIEKGNNQSMELYEDSVNGDWSVDDNGIPQFFIINEAVIQKLCILGENVEPCFEGAGIAAQFSFDGDYKNKMFSMIRELQAAVQEGGNTQMNENENKPEVVTTEPDSEFKKNEDDKEKKPPFPPEEGEGSESDKKDSEDPEKDKEKPEDEEDKKKKEKKFSLEEIPEYVELATKFAQLQKDYDSLNAEIAPLREFKSEAEKKDKQTMIDSFYMLSDAEKKDVVDNIDKYSLSDIEAKLSIICVRNKVNFNLDDDKKSESPSTPMTYTLGDNDDGDSAPAWIKAVRDTAKNMN